MREMTVAPEHRVGGSRGERRAGIRLAMLATFFFSTSAVLVRIAASLGPLEVASYRLIAGAGFVALAALVSGAGLRLGTGPGAGAGEGSGTGQGSGAGEVSGTGQGSGAGLSRGAGPSRAARSSATLLPTVAAGLVAALHFALYIGSLYQTTIAHALVLVNLSPILAMPLAGVFLGERPDPRRLPGVLLVIAGLAVMVGLEPTLTRAMLNGDAMAFGAALAYAVYSLIGRSQRKTTNLLAYIFRVYLVAGLVLLPLALAEAGGAIAGAAAGAVGAAAGAAGPGAAGVHGLVQALLAVLLLAALPTAGGHTLYNAALRRADTVTVNLISTQEVTGGVLLGIVFLGEKPSLESVLGGLLALLGLYLALRGRKEEA